MLQECGFSRGKNGRHDVSVQFILTLFQNVARAQGLDGVETKEAEVNRMKKTLLAHWQKATRLLQVGARAS